MRCIWDAFEMHVRCMYVVHGFGYSGLIFGRSGFSDVRGLDIRGSFSDVRGFLDIRGLDIRGSFLDVRGFRTFGV